VLPLEALLRLPERGAGALEEILRMADRGDWLTRSLALSAAGRIARADPFAARVHPFRHWIARRLPALRSRFPSAGYQGKYVRNQIANALVDRSWTVRTAAALAVAECGARSMSSSLRPLLAGPYRGERVAAAAALISLGEAVAIAPAALLDDALTAPRTIGDTTATLEFLTVLAAGHVAILESWRRLGGDAPRDNTPQSWAQFLAGMIEDEPDDGIQAEIDRYAGGEDTEYLLTKPFSRINRVQNARLLHSFLAVVEQLRVPPEGRVLDLGAGSGWVSELLAKFGYRPFSLDLSTALLTLGKERLERERVTPRLAAGDMTRLPIATSSMEAVIVMDALHHVPAAADVYREAYRVLVEGGQFALAEPGEGHAETEKARSERIEHHVHEREVHMFEAIAHARSAGFTDIKVVPHYVPSISMTPEEVKHAMRAPADRWTIQQDGRPGLYPQFVLQSMLCRPIIVFGKGRRRIDSRLPQVLKAEITGTLDRDGATVDGTASIRNTGDTVWLGSGERLGHVLLGIHLLDSNRSMLQLDFCRIRLTSDVEPGALVELNVSVTLPDGRKPYVLKLDLVDEGICWFEEAGSRPIYVPV
jgi:SAM-dependent methyltransferase